jgi:hypothetical protein
MKKQARRIVGLLAGKSNFSATARTISLESAMRFSFAQENIDLASSTAHSSVKIRQEYFGAVQQGQIPLPFTCKRDITICL